MIRKFSERMGIVKASEPQLLEVSTNLRNSLWNIIFIFLINDWVNAKNPFRNSTDRTTRKQLENIHIIIVLKVFKKPIDDFDFDTHINSLKYRILKGEWNLIYEELEEICNISEVKELEGFTGFTVALNNILEKENSAYRLVNNFFTTITNEEEIKEIERVVNQDSFDKIQEVSSHLSQALRHLKPDGDLRNVIKESISMVETVAKVLEPGSSSLGKALNKLEKGKKINSLLKEKYAKFYEYTNSEDGIRHALMDDANIQIEDARYFLIACSAFTNYLIEKHRKLQIN